MKMRFRKTFAIVIAVITVLSLAIAANAASIKETVISDRLATTTEKTDAGISENRISIDDVISAYTEEELQALVSSSGTVVFKRQMDTETLGSLVKWEIEVYCTISQRADGQYYFSNIEVCYLREITDLKAYLIYTSVYVTFSNSYYSMLSNSTVLEVETDITITTTISGTILPFSWTESHSVQVNASDVV
jgi:hypothetical protein